jgi:hypothetical protein
MLESVSRPTAMTVRRIISESVTTSVKPEQARPDQRGIPLRRCEWMVSPGNRPVLLRVIDGKVIDSNPEVRQTCNALQCGGTAERRQDL